MIAICCMSWQWSLILATLILNIIWGKSSLLYFPFGICWDMVGWDMINDNFLNSAGISEFSVRKFQGRVAGGKCFWRSISRCSKRLVPSVETKNQRKDVKTKGHTEFPFFSSQTYSDREQKTMETVSGISGHLILIHFSILEHLAIPATPQFFPFQNGILSLNHFKRLKLWRSNSPAAPPNPSQLQSLSSAWKTQSWHFFFPIRLSIWEKSYDEIIRQMSSFFFPHDFGVKLVVRMDKNQCAYLKGYFNTFQPWTTAQPWPKNSLQTSGLKDGVPQKMGSSEEFPTCFFLPKTMTTNSHQVASWRRSKQIKLHMSRP